MLFQFFKYFSKYIFITKIITLHPDPEHGPFTGMAQWFHIMSSVFSHVVQDRRFGMLESLIK